MKQKEYVPITRKVNIIIILSLIFGIGAISFFFGRSLSSTIDRSTENNLSRQSEILFIAIENFMIPGDAPIAVQFFQDIESRNPDYTIRLFRSNGDEAFTDNQTIREVNENLGTDRFKNRNSEKQSLIEPVFDKFDKATGIPPLPVLFREREEDQVFFRIYKPLINLPKCTGCHGSTHTVRGVIDIRSNISDSVQDRRNSLIISGFLFLVMVGLLTTVLSQFMRIAIITPVKKIGEVCSSVTRGNFESRVNIKNRDEIGVLGNTVNTMVEGLHERFKLSKYVSSTTLQSLKETERGKKVPVTMFFSDIRGFTNYSENHDPETVVSHLNKVLNYQTDILINRSGDVDKYVGDEIVAMFTGEKPELSACLAAYEIQKEFSEKSKDSYGGLTVGIGINTGEVILGMIGSENRADFTAIGDNVNIASRLCTAAKPFQILISASTYEKIADHATVDGPYKLKAKGKNKYIKVYLIKGIKNG